MRINWLSSNNREISPLNLMQRGLDKNKQHHVLRAETLKWSKHGSHLTSIDMIFLVCMAGLSLGATATSADADLVTTMFEAIGKIHVVEEKLLNAVTGVRYLQFVQFVRCAAESMKI